MAALLSETSVLTPAGWLKLTALPAFGGMIAAFAFASAAVKAQGGYPSKPIRIVVPFAAGGPTDIVARLMGAKMAELLGQQFVVENRTGAGGNIGADVAAKAFADGYTLLMATVSTHAINPGLYKNMPYDPVRDFAPIGQVGVTPTLLAVHPSVRANDVNSLVAVIRKNPGKLTYGSSGLGSILHLCGEEFGSLAGGLSIVHVPYRGSTPMMTDLISGQISMAFDATPTALPQVTCPIGAKSRTGSYGMFLYNPGLIACVDTVAISNVYPSAKAFAATSAPILPPAPAAKGTTMRIGFDGYPSWAFTAALANAKAAIMPPKAGRAVSFNHPAGVKTEVSLSRPAITLHQRHHPAEGACPVSPGAGRGFGVTIHRRGVLLLVRRTVSTGDVKANRDPDA